MQTSVRPPIPDEVATKGEHETFRGTNPWSGPYPVIAIIIGAFAVVGGIVLAAVIGLIAH